MSSRVLQQLTTRDEQSFFLIERNKLRSYLARARQMASWSATWCACVTGLTMQPLEMPTCVMGPTPGGEESSRRLQASTTVSRFAWLAITIRMPGHT